MARFIDNYTFHGRSSKTIEASSKEEAEELTWDEVERDDFEMDADEIDDVYFTVSEMHPVTRDGREIWTTYVRDGDQRGHASALAASPLFGGA